MHRLLCLGLLMGCADAPLDPATEAPPAAPEADIALKAGTVRCDPHPRVGYEAGLATDITVVEVDGQWVEVATANAYAVMQAAAAADGVSLRIYSGFRSNEEQAYLYQCYVDCACNQCNLAAAPGYSNHQSGYALDLNTEAPGVYDWLARKGRAYGFARTVPSEDWHWEHFGDGPGGGPCTASGTDQRPAVVFEGLRDATAWTNGQWLRVKVEDARVHHVRYDVDGYDVGVSEDAEVGFAVRLVLHELGRRTVRARAFDALDHPLGEGQVKVTFVAGETPGFALKFDGLRDGGWYRNGVTLRLAAVPPGTTQVEYSAGRFLLGEGDPQSVGHPLRVVVNTLGHRALLARALDGTGAELARTTLLVRVLPGDEAGVGPSLTFLNPEPGGTLANGAALRVVASDGIAGVRFSADGYDLGPAQLKDNAWVRVHRFSRTGQRTLRAVGLDARGVERARQAVNVLVQ